MPINTGANTRISIGPRLSAKLPDTAAAAITLLAGLVYVELGEVESIGDYGDTINDVTFAALAAGRATHLKGLADAGTVELSIGFDAGDASSSAAILPRLHFRLTFCSPSARFLLFSNYCSVLSAFRSAPLSLPRRRSTSYQAALV